MGEVGHSLDSLAQTGLVCQNAVEVFSVQVSQPLDAHLLVISQSAVKKRGHRKTSLNKGKRERERGNYSGVSTEEPSQELQISGSGIRVVPVIRG